MAGRRVSPAKRGPSWGHPQACARLVFSNSGSEGGDRLELSRPLVSLGMWGRHSEEERWALRQSNARAEITTHRWGWRSGPDGCNLQKDRKRKYEEL